MVKVIGVGHTKDHVGVALAQAARDAGARVTLIHAPLAVPVPAGIETAAVESARQMCDAVLYHLANTDVLISIVIFAVVIPILIKKRLWSE